MECVFKEGKTENGGSCVLVGFFLFGFFLFGCLVGFFCFVLVFCFFKTGSYYVALAVLELVL